MIIKRDLSIKVLELSKKYPEAFSRPYEKASGLCYERMLYKNE